MKKLATVPTPIFGFSIKQLRSIFKFIKHDFRDDPFKFPKFFLDTTNSKEVLDAASIAPGEIKEHIEYGEMVQLAYDLLNSNKTSKNYGETHVGSDENIGKVVSALFPSYKMETVIRTSAVEFSGAEATCESFMGYVLYNEQKRDATLVFRGTILMEEWYTDSEAAGQIWGGKPAKDIDAALELLVHPPANTLVAHQGFYSMYTNQEAPAKKSDKLIEREGGKKLPGLHIHEDGPKEKCRKVVGKLIKEGKIDTITIVGHSLGSALAFVAAIDMGEFVNSPELKQYNWKGKINAICYACPKVGTAPVISRYVAENRVNFFHYYNRGDIVPTGPMPGVLDHPKNTIKRRFDPARVKAIDPKRTGSLWHIHVDNLGAMHNLRHIMYNMWYTSSQAHEGDLDLASIKMDKSLVNWSDDMLSPDDNVPGNWFYKTLIKKFPEIAEGKILPDTSVGEFINLHKAARLVPAEVTATVGA